MGCSQGLLPYGHRPLQHGLGLGIFALGLIHCRQIVQGDRHVGMGWPQGFFIYRQGPLVQGLGLGIFALGLLHCRQIVQRSRHLGMVRTKCALCNFQCFLGYLGRLRVPSLLIKRASFNT